VVVVVVVVVVEEEEEEEEVVMQPSLQLLWYWTSGVQVDVAIAVASSASPAAVVVGAGASTVKGEETEEVSDKGKAERTLRPTTCLRAFTPLSVRPQRETHAEALSGMSLSLMHAMSSWASTVSISSSPFEANPL